MENSHGKVTALTAATFEELVINSDKPVVIDFWAEWCGPCRQMKSTFASASEQIEDAVFLAVNVDEEPKISEAFGIRSIPTFVTMKGNRVVDAFAGGASPAEFVKKIQAAVEKAKVAPVEA